MTPLTSSSTEFDYINILQQQDFAASEEANADEKAPLIALPQTPQEVPAAIGNTLEAPSATETTTDSYIYNLESTPLLLCKEQYEAIVTLTNNSLITQIDRMARFYFNNMDYTYKVIDDAVANHQVMIPASMAIGAGLGILYNAATAFYTFGSFFNPQISIGMNVLRFATAYSLGVLGGGTTSGAVYVAEGLIKGKDSTQYWEWCQKMKEEKLYPLYQGIITQEGHPLHKYTCPFTKNLIKCPYKTPKGRVYEKDAIEAWLKSKTVKDIIKRAKAAQTDQEREQLLLQTSPSGDEILVTGEKLDQREISYCWEYHGDVCKAIQRYREGQMEVLCEREKDLITEGLKNYRKSIEKTALQMMRALNELNENLLWHKKISRERYYAEHRKITEHYMLFSRGIRKEEKQEESKINA